MSERVDKFCNDLRDHLNGLEAKLDQVKNSVQTASDQSREALEAERQKIVSAFEADKQKIADAKAQLDERVEVKKTETESKIAEWKHNHEVHKLEKRADRAEDYAAGAVLLASAAVEEAQLSVLEAIAARLDAEAVAST